MEKPNNRPVVCESITKVWAIVPEEFDGKKGRLVRVSRCNDDEFKLVVEYG